MAESQTVEHLMTVLSKLGSGSIGVIGDVILDHYIHGRMERLSAEAPIPIVDVEHETLHLGGAANVAENLVSLGHKVLMFSVIGADHFGRQLTDLMATDKAVELFIATDANRKTTVKQRLMVDDRQISRADFENRNTIDTQDKDFILRSLLDNARSLGALVLEDYDKGVLDPDFIREIMEFARSAQIMTFVDPKFENFFAYNGATVFKPNLREASDALGRAIDITDSGIMAVCEELQQRIQCDNVLLTLGRHGVALLDSKAQFTRLPAMVRFVHDAAGAGDTVIGVTASAMASGASLLDAVTLANLAAGAICEKVGVQPVTIDDIRFTLEFHSRKNAAPLQPNDSA